MIRTPGAFRLEVGKRFARASIGPMNSSQTAGQPLPLSDRIEALVGSRNPRPQRRCGYNVVVVHTPTPNILPHLANGGNRDKPCICSGDHPMLNCCSRGIASSIVIIAMQKAGTRKSAA
jgi:hypothetical protein